MQVITTPETVAEVKKILDSQPQQPRNVRIFLAGMG